MSDLEHDVWRFQEDAKFWKTSYEECAQELNECRKKLREYESSHPSPTETREPPPSASPGGPSPKPGLSVQLEAISLALLAILEQSEISFAMRLNMVSVLLNSFYQANHPPIPTPTTAERPNEEGVDGEVRL